MRASDLGFRLGVEDLGFAALRGNDMEIVVIYMIIAVWVPKD